MRLAFAADMTPADSIVFTIPGEPETTGMVAACQTVNDGRTRVTEFRLIGRDRNYRVSANFHIAII